MTVHTLKLTLDSYVQSEGEREKLAYLHSLIVREVSAMDIGERVKITLECGSVSSANPASHAKQLVVAGADMEPMHSAAGGPIVKLSERQREIAIMLCNHYSVRKIAKAFYVSENTVKKHVQNIKKTLEIEDSGADFIFSLKQLISSKKTEEPVAYSYN
ncbi:response regulator transcription factor [Paenibacillus sp. y28]|uniref:response regulator transcription factor n=1 Tax=Paenibacillus sp. y28 TaxID=3129110 RepID=UPI00301AC7DD